jgi:hypothetical protein
MPGKTLRSQLGVTDVMIDQHGAQIFELSHNIQKRTGDPIRAKDFDALEAQRADLGLTDDEIAARVGLEPAQVMYIRTVEERRRFHTGHYRRLYKLGGGKRYRPEREGDESS